MLRDEPRAHAAATAEWQGVLNRFESVGLESVAGTATTDRIDTKFLLRAEQILEVLAVLPGAYRVLDVDGNRFTTYRTQYFDTESYSLFRRHHSGGSDRYKVRTRMYLNTRMSFVEIKRKSRRNATTKARLRTPEFETVLLPDARQFVSANCSIAAGDLEPMLLNQFDRICFVNSDARERLTIDLNVEVEAQDSVARLPGIAIAEFKQERNGHIHRDARFLRTMRALNVRPTAFSKYCIGLLLTRGGIKHNRFKPQLRKLEHLMGEPNVVG